MKERILAIVAAVALVAVAIAARSVLVDDDDAGASGGGRPVVACTEDLMAICDALVADGAIAPDPPALDLGGDDMADRGIDGWITWDGAPGVADLDATDAGREAAWGETRPIAASTLAVTTSGGLTLPEGCTFEELTWSCLLDAAGEGLAVGVGTGRTAESLSRLYPLALTLVGDADFRSLDGAPLRTVVESPRDAVDRRAYAGQVRTLLTKRGALNLVVAPLGLLEEEALTAFAAAPDASMTAVIAARADAELDLDRDLASDRVTAAVTELGLRLDPDAELAPERRAGELYALREKVG